MILNHWEGLRLLTKALFYLKENKVVLLLCFNIIKNDLKNNQIKDCIGKFN